MFKLRELNYIFLKIASKRTKKKRFFLNDSQAERKHTTHIVTAAVLVGKIEIILQQLHTVPSSYTCCTLITTKRISAHKLHFHAATLYRLVSAMIALPFYIPVLVDNIISRNYSDKWTGINLQ